MTIKVHIGRVGLNDKKADRHVTILVDGKQVAFNIFEHWEDYRQWIETKLREIEETC